MVRKPDFDIGRLLEDPAGEIARLCTIDVFHMEETMTTHVLLYAHAVAMFEDTKAEVAAAEGDLRYMQSQEYRELFTDKKMSIGKAEKMVGAQSNLVTQQMKVQKLTRRLGVLRAFVSALETRRDIIIQIASRQRAEMQHYS